MSDKKNYNLRIAYAMGRETNLGRARNIEESWGKLVDRFRQPVVTHENFAEYRKLSDKAQKDLKQSGGWFLRTKTAKGKRKRGTVEPGNIITLDLDYVTPDFYEELCAGRVLPGVLHFWHTTRSHTPEKPKVRLVIRTKQRITRENYSGLVRILSLKVGIKYIDKVSARTAQMMFMPTVSKDMEKHFGFREEEGEPLDLVPLKEEFEEDNRSIDDIRNLPLFPGEKGLRETADKVEDPIEKEGEVGDFCRAWTITELIEGKTVAKGNHHEGPLAEAYEIVEWSNGVATWATYLHGTSSHGAVIYEDKFIYSHHGSDPAQEQLLNAYDLVRIHLFGDQDGSDDEDAPMRDRPSVKAMREFLKDDQFYRIAATDFKYDIDAMMDDAGIEEAEEPEEVEIPDDVDDATRRLLEWEAEEARETYERLKASKPPKGWVGTQLTLNAQGEIRSDVYNLVVILTNDPRLHRKVAFNEFTGEPVILDDIKSKNPLIQPIRCLDRVNGTPWQAHFDEFLHAILSSPRGKNKSGYGLKAAEGDLFKAIKIAAKNNTFNPIKEMLIGADKKHPDEGVDHLAEFPSKFLGTVDDPYYQEVFKKAMIASVARVYEPGCKFDFMPVLQGPQGLGKSSLIEMIYGEYFGELDADLADRRTCAEQIIGKWGIEMPELASLSKADHNHAKQFLSRKDDTTRLAYDRSNTVLDRRAVFWGTSNPDKPLRDRTGNRRYWMIHCGISKLDFRAVEAHIPKLWAQAYRDYLKMRAGVPASRDLDLSLSKEAHGIAEVVQEAARRSEAGEEWADQIEDWFQTPVTVFEIACQMNPSFHSKNPEYGDPWPKDLPPHDLVVLRMAATQAEIREHALGMRAGAVTAGAANSVWQGAVEILKERGYEFTTTKGSVGTKSPRLGSVYVDGRGVQKGWVLAPGGMFADHQVAFLVRGEADDEIPNEWDDLI